VDFLGEKRDASTHSKKIGTRIMKNRRDVGGARGKEYLRGMEQYSPGVRETAFAPNFIEERGNLVRGEGGKQLLHLLHQGQTPVMTDAEGFLTSWIFWRLETLSGAKEGVREGGC